MLKITSFFTVFSFIFTPKFTLLFRGVAKVVSRQFRVLETVGSSPAASTKKRGITPVVIPLFFFLIEAVI